MCRIERSIILSIDSSDHPTAMPRNQELEKFRFVGTSTVADVGFYGRSVHCDVFVASPVYFGLRFWTTRFAS